MSQGRIQALLAYLLLHRGEPQVRRHLAFLFWPDTNDAQAQTNLRTLLYRLRRALPHVDRFLSVDAQAILWRDDDRMHLDVAEFEAATAESAPLSDLRRGIELFRGELLPEVYDEWVETERKRLHRRFARAAERACRICEANRDYAGAIEFARRLASHDPLDEESYRRLMRLHALTGQRTAALLVFRECEDVLQRELGLSPDPATHGLYERLLAVDDPGDVFVAQRPIISGTQFVGRTRELERLQRSWRDTLAGSARLVLVVGEAGIGKTRLVAELADWVGRQGFAVASGRAYAPEGEFAYAPIVPWVRSGLMAVQPTRLDPLWLTELARVLPELATRHPALPSPPPISEPGERERFAEALVRGALARSTPTLLLLDDMQWCASETLGWLHYLLRTNEGAPVLVLGTLRSGESEDNPALARLITALEREGRFDAIELAALTDPESERLAAAALGTDTSPSAAVYQGAEGNPLFIMEMVRFHETRSPADSDQAVPPSVSGIIRARLAQLSDDSLRLLRCAAVVGRRAPLSLVGPLSEIEGSRLAGSLDQLQTRGVVEIHEQQWIEIAHDLIRDQCYADIGPALRRHLHGAVADALQRSTPDPVELSAEIARHDELAGRSDAAVDHYLDAASFSLRAGASDEALRLLGRAFELTEADHATETKQRGTMFVEILERTGDVLYLIGQYADSRAALRRALGHADSPLGRARLLRRLGKAAIGERDLEGALESLDEAARQLDVETGAVDAQREWLQIQLDRMSVLYWLGDWRTMEEVDRAMTPVLGSCGSVEQRRQRDWQFVAMSLRRDRYAISDGMVVLARGILSSTVEDGYVPRIAVASFHLAFLLLWHGDLEEAHAEAKHALELAVRTGDRNLELRCLTYLAVIARFRRDSRMANAHAQRAEAAATVVGHQEYLGAALANRAWVALNAGDRAGALALGQSAISAWESLPEGSPGFMFEWLGRLVLIAVILRRRGVAQVAAAVNHARRILHPSQQRLPDPMVATLESAIRAWESDDSSAARARLRDALAFAGVAGLI